MRHLFTVLLLLTLPALAAGGYFAHQHITEKLFNASHKILSDLGFENVQIQTPQVKTHQALFSDITLDKEGFSTIKHLLIEYDPVDMLLHQKIKAIRIIEPNLTGEILGNPLAEDASIGIAGWNGKAENIAKLQPQATDTLIEIRGLSADILTESFGGLSIKSDIQIRPNAEQGLDIKGTLDTQQKHFGFSSKVSGFITTPSLWQVELEMSAGRAEFDTAKSSRISGTTKISNTRGEGISVFSKLESGGLSLFETPWQNASTTLEYRNNALTMFMGAKSIGTENMELSLQYEANKKPAWSGSINAPNIKRFLQYIEKQGLSFSNDEAFEKLSDLDNIEIQFTLENSKNVKQKEINYNIINYEKDIDIDGKLIFEP